MSECYLPRRVTLCHRGLSVVTSRVRRLPIAETGKRRPKFRIELPGNPILGDGKSDNHPVIFYFGMQTLIMLLHYPFFMDISFNLFLDHNSCFVLVTIHFQSSSILVCRLC